MFVEIHVVSYGISYSIISMIVPCSTFNVSKEVEERIETFIKNLKKKQEDILD